MQTPSYGKRKMVVYLQTQGYRVDRQRVRCLMQMMGWETMYPKPHLSRAGEIRVHSPYLLRDLLVDRCDQVWSCDIAYIRLARGFVYLMAIIDWFSRYVLVWELSTTLDTSFCVDASSPCVARSDPGDFQYRSRGSVYQYRVSQSAQSRQDSHQLGWPRTGLRYHLCGAAVAQRAIRRYLFEGVSGGARSEKGASRLVSSLQL